ncbi:unnamed protein product [Owenia fusiformis]|uniref:Uncharacterized protein n=1 Tax=Owenia fusiformis TaxID=6347 RepID=A0A8J1TFM7_OWEFU|nr:unnamed protein product [Owenia fusiformis]
MDDGDTWDDDVFTGRGLFEGQSTSTLHSLERHIADMDSMSSIERLDLSLQVSENATEDTRIQLKATPFKGGVILGTAMKEKVKGSVSKMVMQREVQSHDKALLSGNDQTGEVEDSIVEDNTKSDAAARFIPTSNFIHLGYHEYQSADSVKPIIGPRFSLVDTLWFKLHCTKQKCIVIVGAVIFIVTLIVVTLAVVLSRH